MTTPTLPRPFPHLRRFPLPWLIVFVACVCGRVAGAADPETPPGKVHPEQRAFAIPAGEAFSALKRFFVQSGEQVIYRADALAGVRTKPVEGTYTPLEALTRMLSGTELTVTRDEPTGTLAIKPINGARAQRTNSTPGAANPPLSPKKKRTNP